MSIAPLTPRHPNKKMAIMAKATQFLSTMYNIPIKIQEWDQFKASHIFDHGSKEHRIAYSQKIVDECYDAYLEYPSLQKAIPQCNGAKEYGLYLLATHEFAHAIQTTIPGGRTKDSCHNQCFVNCLLRIRREWRYDAFCDLCGIEDITPEYVSYTERKIMGVRNVPAPQQVPYIPGKALMPLSQVAKITGVRYQQLYQKVQKGQFQKYGQFVDFNEINIWACSRTVSTTGASRRSTKK